MKKFLVLSFIATVLVVACNKKAVPVITERKTEPSKDVTTPSAVAIKPDTAIGKTVFVTRCGKCHDLPEPVQFNEKKWDAILLSMIPKARLTDEQGIHVTAYVKANAAK